MEFPQGESMGSIYLSNLDMTQSNLGMALLVYEV
jgi:hypothetical protein